MYGAGMNFYADDGYYHHGSSFSFSSETEAGGMRERGRDGERMYKVHFYLLMRCVGAFFTL